jgi:hypothetical protein
MKTGLFKSPFTYYGKNMPVDISGLTGIAENTNGYDLSYDSINNLEFNGTTGYYMYIDTNNTADIGVNNNVYTLLIPEEWSLYVNSPYFSFSGNSIYQYGEETINLNDTYFKELYPTGTLYIVNSANGYLCHSQITSIGQWEPNNTYAYYVNHTEWIFDYGTSDLPGPNSDDQQITIFNAYSGETGTGSTDAYYENGNYYNSSCQAYNWATNQTSYPTLDITSPLTTLIIQPNNGSDMPDVNNSLNYAHNNGGTVIISDVNSTITVQLYKHYYYGTTSMTVNMPSTPITYSIEIGEPNSDKSEITGSIHTLQNKFVASTSSDWYNSYFPPPKDYFSKITSVNDIENLNGITGYINYMPTLLPGNDYTISKMGDTGFTMYWTSIDSASMDADQCRQPWRLSNYVRSNKDPDNEILQIAINTALAMYYSASSNESTDLSLGINVYTFIHNGTGYSGDMVPGLVALIDALNIKNITCDSSELLNQYSSNIKALGSSYSFDSKCTNLSNSDGSIYPILDSVTSGGQQLGLAGVSLICTKDFLLTDGYNVMNKYDHMKTWGEYDTLFIESYTSETNVEDDVKLYNLLCMKGNGFKSWTNWGNDGNSGSYGDKIHNSAYYTNIRVRDINIEAQHELSFGPTEQSDQTTSDYKITSSSGPTTDPISGNPTSTYYDEWSYYSGHTGYVPTYFPMYGIPDSGWSGCTIEILSYQGIRLVGMNDYPGFCAWHRFVYHLLFIQNGGDMFSWSTNPDDKINPVSSVSCVKNKDSNGVNFWIPSYLTDDTDDDILDKTPGNVTNSVTGKDNDWVNTILNPNNIKYFNCYQWPPEYTYTNYTGCYYNSPSGSNPPTTKLWSNRFNPYRGDLNEHSYRWSTPSYCMGFAPTWVVGGKTSNTWDDNNNTPSRPVAEALNPHFSGTGGLYSATDGDSNLFIAYSLAALQWTIPPPSDGITDITGSTGYNGGYDCDVCDFKKCWNYDLDNEGYGSGVYDAVNNLRPNGMTGYLNKTIHITDTIGYGITPGSQGATGPWELSTISHDINSPDAGDRGTTWSYIAKSIQRTMISQNGLGYGSGYGNFTSNKNAPYDGHSSRVVTLGHDTNAGTTVKMDYQDPRIYQICKNMNDL